MVFNKIFSKIDLSPLAPVFLLIAFCAISLMALSLKLNFKSRINDFLSLIHYSNAMRQYTNYGNSSNDKSTHPRVGPGLPPGANNTIHDSATVYNEQSATGPSGAISSQGTIHILRKH